MQSISSLICCHAFQLSWAPLPGALEPGPGMVLPQAKPLHTGQALQLLPMFFLASAKT